MRYDGRDIDGDYTDAADDGLDHNECGDCRDNDKLSETRKDK